VLSNQQSAIGFHPGYTSHRLESKHPMQCCQILSLKICPFSRGKKSASAQCFKEGPILNQKLGLNNIKIEKFKNMQHDFMSNFPSFAKSYFLPMK
jgi:hypothetical protein